MFARRESEREVKKDSLVGVALAGGGADPSERKKMMVSRRQAREMTRPM